MTSEAAPNSDDPQRLLSATRDLARRVRRAQRGAWFPLLMFAVVTFAAVPFDRYGHYRSVSCESRQGGAVFVCSRYSPLAFWYWPAAVVLAYLAICWFYLRRSRRRGVGTRIQPYIAVGLILVVLITGFALWGVHHPIFQAEVAGLHLQSPSSLTNFLYRLASAAGGIGLALLLLAWVERSWGLVVFALAYLTVVLASINFGWVVDHPPWFFLPHLVVAGTVLLLGSALFALAQRFPRQPAR